MAVRATASVPLPVSTPALTGLVTRMVAVVAPAAMSGWAEAVKAGAGPVPAAAVTVYCTVTPPAEAPLNCTVNSAVSPS